MAELEPSAERSRGVFSRRLNAVVPTLHGMDKSNIAFALITAILGVYIAVALVLSRMAGRAARLRKQKRNGPWTSFSS